MRRALVCFAIAGIFLNLAGCAPRQGDVERHLDRGRYARALRAARRAGDPGLRLASETMIAGRLVGVVEGELRITPDSSPTLAARLGSVPPVIARGDALPLTLEVRVARAERVPMSFRVLALSHGGTRFLRTAECPPPEAVGLDCVEWLSGAPLAPPCDASRASDADRAAAAVMRWLSGGLVRVPAAGREEPVCTREPVAIAASQRPELELVARRLALDLATVPRRVSPGGRYLRSELLYASAATGDGDALWLQVSFHVERRSAPLRYTARIPLPEAEAPTSGLAIAFERALPLSGVFGAPALGR